MIAARHAILLTAGFFLSFSVRAQYWHQEPTAEEEDFYLQHPEWNSQLPLNKSTADYTMPADARFPGEFEESQAVAIGWPSNFGNLDTSSGYARLWAKLAYAISLECPVWIRVGSPADTTKLLTYMSNQGMALQQYRFFIYPGNAYWMRDFGPIGFYYSGDDSVGFTDMHYYTTRPLDDQFPAQLAGETGYKNVTASFFAEGGNYLTDGFRKSFHSNKIHVKNQAAYGWTPQQTMDSVKYYWGADSITVTTGLSCDGGTQHIDMYLKLVDEETFAIMEYPSVVTANDKIRIDSMIQMISQTPSTYNRPYRIFKLPMPTQNDGSYLASCSQINNDARTFVNGLTVNKTYIMPAFSSATSGNASGDSAAVATFRQILPGYNIIPVDARLLTVQGGAIHCVTMQIPAENPLRIWHPAVVDMQPWSAGIHLVAKMTNKSGIATAKCKWRKKGNTAWNNINLTDSTLIDFKTADIAGGYAITDTIEYYITATSNNGKTMSKPFAAPAGYYTFYFDQPNGIGPLNPARNFALNPIPNPTSGSFYIPVATERPMRVRAIVMDVLGRRVSETDFGRTQSGVNKLAFDLSGQTPGMYFLRLMADGRLLDTKKVVRE